MIMNMFWQDIRYAFRAIRSQPAFTVVAVLALGIGIGANTAIFSVVNAVLLRALPYHRPDELMVVLEKYARSGSPSNPVSPANFLDLRKSPSFESMAAAEVWGATLS